jgi:hypothetical protein
VANLSANTEYTVGLAEATVQSRSLKPSTSQQVTCKLLASAPRAGNFSDIFFYTNPGGTFHGLLFNGAPQTALTQIASLQSALSELQSQAGLKKLDHMLTRMLCSLAILTRPYQWHGDFYLLPPTGLHAADYGSVPGISG